MTNSSDGMEPPWPETLEPDSQRLQHSTNEDPFMQAGVELLKEAGILATIAAGIIPEEPRRRNEAILVGMMARIAKLSLAMVAVTTNLHGEMQVALFRPVAESVASLIYLLGDPGTGERFDAYVSDSLVSEREFVRTVHENAADRGKRLPIEERILRSIERTAAAAGVRLEDLPPRRRAGWPTAEARIGMVDSQLYEAFRMGSNALHGTWSDLYLNHLEESEEGTFVPRLDHSTPRPQPLLASGALICTALRAFTNHLGDVAGREFEPRVQSLVARLGTVDMLHEQFVQGREAPGSGDG